MQYLVETMSVFTTLQRAPGSQCIMDTVTRIHAPALQHTIMVLAIVINGNTVVERFSECLPRGGTMETTYTIRIQLLSTMFMVDILLVSNLTGLHHLDACITVLHIITNLTGVTMTVSS